MMQFDSADIEFSAPDTIDGPRVAVCSFISGILSSLSMRLRFAIQTIHSAKDLGSKQMTITDLPNSIACLNENLSELRLEGAEQSSKMLASTQCH